MGDEVDLELEVLRKEYESVLKDDVHEGFEYLKTLLSESLKTLNFSFSPEQGYNFRPEKFILSSPNVNQQVKCMVTVVGDLIYETDLALKLQKQQMVPYQTRIYPEVPWKLQQIQDARNQLLKAFAIIENLEGSYNFTSGFQVLSIIEDVLSHLQLGRECLTIPKRKTLEEIVKNPSVKAFNPALPQDAAVSFYIQEYKLILAVYHLYTNQSNRVDISSRFQVECIVPWLSDMLQLFMAASHKCQQLKDKITLLMSCLNDFEPIPVFDSCNNVLDDTGRTSILTDLSATESQHKEKRCLSQFQDGAIQNNNMMVNWFVGN